VHLDDIPGVPEIRDNSNGHTRSVASYEYFLIHIWVYFVISKHSFLR